MVNLVFNGLQNQINQPFIIAYRFFEKQLTMKALTLIFTFISVFSFSQSYDLLPDTCTHCSWIYTTGGTTLYAGSYTLFPEEDTLHQGNVYMRLPLYGPASNSLIGVRQVGNKVMGFLSSDSTQEYLIQDWDVNVGDTIFNLYDFQGNYDAVFLGEDSTIMNNGNYHHYHKMKGINGAIQNEEWLLTWNERGLCSTMDPNWNSGWGGLLFNNKVQFLGAHYAEPKPHTPDPRYNLNQIVSGCDIQGVFNSLSENNIKNIAIHPNPTSGKIALKTIDFGISEIQLLDSKGNIILNTRLENGSVDLSNFENGIYFLRIKSSDNMAHQAKIIKVE